MDVVLALVILGCAVAGLFWGAVRMASWVAALIAAVLAGRWVAPAVGSMLAGVPEVHGHERVLATVASAVLAAVLVLLAGRGLRKGLEALHLGWLDRLGGGLLGAVASAAILAVTLALAAEAGQPPSTPWALGLAGAGKVVLALHSTPASSAIPSSTPAAATSSGQHPH